MKKKILITGGAGFIGTNLAKALLEKGEDVTILDNLSRQGTESNLKWLEGLKTGSLDFIKGDIRDFKLISEIVPKHPVVFHLAGQVAVTASVIDPRTDFDVNMVGTLNILEAARKSKEKPIILISSTNKVYGNLGCVNLTENLTRYEAPDFPVGINEKQNLDFHSPYGCSKGASEQYVHDYARIYNIPTVVCRMSCIYGTRQFGNEDQGWIAHFIISWLLKRPITIYGNGKQVRDILFVSDLIEAFKSAVEQIDKSKGQIFNLGGGITNAISLLELIKFLKEFFAYEVPVTFSDLRSGDQKFYVTDTRKAKTILGWEPTCSKKEGLEHLISWAKQNINIFKR